MDQSRTYLSGKPHSCPACGHQPVASLLFGLPDMSDDLKRDVEQERIVLGGCCVTGDEPAWQCGQCGWQGWRESPRRRRRNH